MQILGYRGKVAFADQDIAALSTEERKALKKDMQMVFQDPFNSH